MYKKCIRKDQRFIKKKSAPVQSALVNQTIRDSRIT